jgi:hypothetical protein
MSLWRECEDAAAVTAVDVVRDVLVGSPGLDATALAEDIVSELMAWRMLSKSAESVLISAERAEERALRAPQGME